MLLRFIPKEISEEKKSREKDLSRKRSLTFPVIIMILLNLVKDGNRKGYEITMNQFWSEASRFNIKLNSLSHPTKGAFSQAREKVKAETVKDIMMSVIDEFDRKYGSDYLWHDMRLFAIDGTKYTLPASETLIKKFGQQKCGGDKYSHYPLATISVLFNVRSKIAYDLTINKANCSEREELIEVCKTLTGNDLIIADRGYPGYKVFYYLMKKGINFLVRVCESSTFKEVENFVKQDLEDEEIELGDNRKNGEKIKLRVIKAVLPNGEKRFFISNLMDKKKYKYEELINLYYERWEIEEHYKSNKEFFKVENFHSKSENGILQEIYAQLILSNLTRYIINDAEYNKKDSDDVPCFKNAVCVVERYLNEIILCNDENSILILYEKMLKEIRSVRYKKIRNRKCKRISFKPISRWSVKKCP